MKKYFGKFIEFAFKVIGYALILMLTSLIFQNTLYIDNSNYGLWCFMAALIICILNVTIKPFLVWLTIPITGITLGLFYPIINLVILKVTSFILGDHFTIYGFWFAFFASILISLLNVFLDHIIKKIERRNTSEFSD